MSHIKFFCILGWVLSLGLVVNAQVEDSLTGRWLNTSLEQRFVDECQFLRIRSESLDVSPDDSASHITLAHQTLSLWDFPLDPILCGGPTLQAASWPVQGRFRNDGTIALSRTFGQCDIGDCKDISVHPGSLEPEFVRHTIILVNSASAPNEVRVALVEEDAVAKFFTDSEFALARVAAEREIQDRMGLVLIDEPTTYLPLLTAIGTPEGLFFIQNAKPNGPFVSDNRTVALFAKFTGEAGDVEIKTVVY